jgi:hypothetical protein
VCVGTQEEEAAANGKATESLSGVDNDDDAILLLKALASQDSDVRPPRLDLCGNTCHAADSPCFCMRLCLC